MALKFRRGASQDQSGSLIYGEPFISTTLNTLLIGGNGTQIQLLNISGGISSSLTPSTGSTFDLGTAANPWRHLYIASASIKFINGSGTEVATLSSDIVNALSSNSGSLNTFTASATIRLTNLETTSASVSSSISQLNTFTSSTAALGSLNTFTASATIRLTNLETTTASLNISVSNLNTSTSSFETKGRGIISGSSQLSGTTITNLTVVNLTTVNETASVIFSSGSNTFGDFGNDIHSFTGSVQISGSLTITGSVSAANGFTGSLLGTASYALNGSSNAFLYQTASAASVWTFNHYLQTRYPVIQVYDNTDSVIIPQSITAVDNNTTTITFSSARTGTAVASKGGYVGSVVTSATTATSATSASVATTASYAISASAAATTFGIGASSTTYGSYINTIAGANTIISTPTGSYSGAFYKYVATSGSNARAGEVMAIWNNTTTQFTDVTTNDIGSTTMVTSSVSLSAGNAVLSFTTNTNNWNIKTFVTYL
jgi:epidermal growth factor receptor substrate 15